MIKIRSVQTWGTAILIMVFSFGCGVRQYNGKLGKTSSKYVIAYAPFWSAGQIRKSGGGNQETLETGTCGGVSTRPCTRARASLGIPFQFDQNSFTDQGPLGLPVSVNYVSTGGAGRLLSSGPSSTQPRFENRDLYIMKRQTDGADLVFP